MRGLAIGLCLAAVAITAGSQAFADAIGDQCIDTNRKAQLLRMNSKLLAARDALRICSDTHCPVMVRDDCVQRLDELNRMQPSLVFDGKDAAGNDVIAAAVTVDGRPLTDRLDGSPLNVDPGPHTFEFVVPGLPPVIRTFVLKEGEKGRVERIVLGPAPRPPSSPAEPLRGTPDRVSSPATESAGDGLGAGRISGLVIAAIGLGGVAAGSVYGLLAQSAWNDSKSECSAANCPAAARPQAVADHSVAVTDGTVSTIALIAGGVLLTSGIAVFLASPAPGARSERGAVRITPTFGPGAAGLDFRGTF